MVARGLPDPYCRWVPPREFEAMKKYDVTGVGLNLGTGEEYVKKTVRRRGVVLCPASVVRRRRAGAGAAGAQPGWPARPHSPTRRALRARPPRAPQGRELPARRAPEAAGDVWVVGISRGSAADAAGLEQGDQITAVAGRRLGGLSPFQASAMISGGDEEGGGGDDAPSSSSSSSSGGSSVTLAVRKADGRAEEFVVARAPQQLASPVRSSLATRGGVRVGVVAVKSFTARAQRDVAAAVGELTGRGAQALELDLRDNRCARSRAGGQALGFCGVARLGAGGSAGASGGGGAKAPTARRPWTLFPPAAAW